MNRSLPSLPVHHQLPEFTQTHIHRVSDAIQPSHPLSSPSPPVPNPSQHQSLFQWVNSSHEVAKVLEVLTKGYFKLSSSVAKLYLTLIKNKSLLLMFISEEENLLQFASSHAGRKCSAIRFSNPRSPVSWLSQDTLSSRAHGCSGEDSLQPEPLTSHRKTGGMTAEGCEGRCVTQRWLGKGTRKIAGRKRTRMTQINKGRTGLEGKLWKLQVIGESEEQRKFYKLGPDKQCQEAQCSISLWHWSSDQVRVPWSDTSPGGSCPVILLSHLPERFLVQFLCPVLGV